MTFHFTEDDLNRLREEARDRRGIYTKFVVFKTDDGGLPTGQPLDGFYFVLRPDRDVHALEALRAYAKSAGYEASTRNLARDLGKWIKSIEDRQFIADPPSPPKGTDEAGATPETSPNVTIFSVQTDIRPVTARKPTAPTQGDRT